jgi:hypothetical protein
MLVRTRERIDHEVIIILIITCLINSGHELFLIKFLLFRSFDDSSFLSSLSSGVQQQQVLHFHFKQKQHHFEIEKSN